LRREAVHERVPADQPSPAAAVFDAIVRRLD
jgi:hypothetical protein